MASAALAQRVGRARSLLTSLTDAMDTCDEKDVVEPMQYHTTALARKRTRMEALVDRVIAEEEEERGRSGAGSSVAQSRVCRPFSRIDLYRRIKTFRITNWFSKPNAISPLVCASYGWRNSGTDEIECEVCNAKLRCKVTGAMGQTSEQLRQQTAAFLLQMKDSHASLCPWRYSTCPPRFIRPDIFGRAGLLVSYTHVVQELRTPSSSAREVGDAPETPPLSLHFSAATIAHLTQSCQQFVAALVSGTTLEPSVAMSVLVDTLRRFVSAAAPLDKPVGSQPAGSSTNSSSASLEEFLREPVAVPTITALSGWVPARDRSSSSDNAHSCFACKLCDARYTVGAAAPSSMSHGGAGVTTSSASTTAFTTSSGGSSSSSSGSALPVSSDAAPSPQDSLLSAAKRAMAAASRAFSFFRSIPPPQPSPTPQSAVSPPPPAKRARVEGEGAANTTNGSSSSSSNGSSSASSGSGSIGIGPTLGVAAGSGGSSTHLNEVSTSSVGDPLAAHRWFCPWAKPVHTPSPKLQAAFLKQCHLHAGGSSGAKDTVEAIGSTVRRSLARLAASAFGSADPAFLAGYLGISAESANCMPHASCESTDQLVLSDAEPSATAMRVPGWILALLVLSAPTPTDA